MPTVLFVCEGNRFRSQIAEAFFNAWAPPGWTAVSAGTNPKASLHPKVVELMDEMGINLSRAKPKAIDLEVARSAARAVAMCSLASCPPEVGARAEHWGVVNPADVPESSYPAVRDEIAERVKALIREIARAKG